MDLRRHVTAGRLAELVGAAGLETDKVDPHHGVAPGRRGRAADPRAADPPDAPGLRRRRQHLPARPQPRRGRRRVLVLGSACPTPRSRSGRRSTASPGSRRWPGTCSGNYTDELARARLSGRLTPAQINQIYPAYDFEAHPADPLAGGVVAGAAAGATSSAVPSALTTGAAPRRVRHGIRRAAAADDRLTSPGGDRRVRRGAGAPSTPCPALLGRGEGIGSNAWAVSGSRTTTGKPLLANDPHLGVEPARASGSRTACTAARSRRPARSTSAASRSRACPGVVIGHNGQIAWGFTNLGPDVTDFYLERVVGDTYLRDGDWEQVTTREEIIRIARRRRPADHRAQHRPRAGDVRRPRGRSTTPGGARPPRRRATRPRRTPSPSPGPGSIPSRTADAILDLNLATDFDQFREAARVFAVPAQNLVYADTPGPHRLPGPRAGAGPAPGDPARPAGYWPAPGLGLALRLAGLRRRSPSCRGRSTPPTASSSPPTRPSPRSATPVPHHRLGPRLALDADRRAARRPSTRSARPTWRRSRCDSRTPSPRCSSRRCSTCRWGRPRPTPTPTACSSSPARRASCSAAGTARHPAGDDESGAAAAYYNAVWRNLIELLFDDELPVGLKADGGGRATGPRSSRCSPTRAAPGGTTSSPPTSPRARTRSCARPSSRPGSS